jgi:exopolysaccharide biosynthesis polyprenyl glycosylphosphotransferase
MSPLRHTFYFRLKPPERRVLLLTGDFIMACIAVVAALYYWALGDPWLKLSIQFIQERTPFWFFLLPFFWMLLMTESYEEHRSAKLGETFKSILTAALIGLVFYFVIFFFYTTPETLPRRGVAGFVIAASVLTLAWRTFYIRVFTAPQFLRRALLVGGGETGKIIMQIVKEVWPPPYYMVGIIDDDPQKVGQQIGDLSVLAGSDKLLEIIHEQSISDLIVAISGEMRPTMFQALLNAQELGLEITRMPVAYEEILGRVPIRYLEADWMLRSFVDHTRVSRMFDLLKRLVDIAGAVVGIGIMSALFPFIALSIVIDSGFPIFYSQKRSGRGGQPYNIIKFRTMRQNAEADGSPQWAEENDKRATRVGHFLRKTHLDELPQFINVLRGEMSLVGPRAERPELVSWFEEHVPFYRARLLVKPGISGWAQVNYGYAATVEETIVKLEYDLYYIKHRNLLMDIIIMLRTPTTVFGRRGR